jgi:hypothetical protein
MPPNRRELWLALITILAVSLLYLLLVANRQAIPAAGGLIGHSIGIVGFILMLLTETLYSLRKRSRSARWGRMSTWLKVHIYMGLVGPYLVLLHTSWKFNGLAGIVTLLTLVIVASGFIGRYIYTAVPRSVDGAEMDAKELERQMSAVEAELQGWVRKQPAAASFLQNLPVEPVAESGSNPGLVLGRAFAEARYRQQWQHELRRLPPKTQADFARLEQLQFQHRTLQRQVESLVMARRLLGLWQRVHIPIGVALFTAAFFHVAGALYYATFLK